MKQLSHILLIIIFLPYLFQGLAFVDYYVRLEYYSTVLCENKEKPELKCNGKCQIKHFINDNYGESKKPTLPPSQFKFEALITDPSVKNDYKYLVKASSFNIFYDKLIVEEGVIFRVWQPPEKEFNQA